MDDDIGVDRARQRATLMYRFTPSLQAGIEWNPLANDLGLLANWRVFDETETWPAVVLGTSSDRIGSTDGRAIFATASKNLEREISLPISPYAGLSYGGQDHDFDALGGLHVRYGLGLESTHFHDGHNLHHVVTWGFEEHSLGILVAEQDGDHFLGVSYSVGFSASALAGILGAGG